MPLLVMEMMTMTLEYNKKVGEVIRVEWDQDTGAVRIVIDVIDPGFRTRVLRNKDFEDIISIRGRDAIIVASKPKKN
jgi:hypothetical protein